MAGIPETVDDGVVRLRRPNLGDAPSIFLAVDASRETLAPWMPWCTPDYSLVDAEAWVMRAAIGWPKGVHCPFVAEEMSDGALVGSAGVNPVGPFDANYNLGYWIRTDRTGRGLARRAARLAAAFAFEHLGAERIGILASCENEASLRVAAAIGGREEGVLRQRFRLQGRRHDAVMFGLLPGELVDVSAF